MRLINKPLKNLIPPTTDTIGNSVVQELQRGEVRNSAGPARPYAVQTC